MHEDDVILQPAMPGQPVAIFQPDDMIWDRNFPARRGYISQSLSDNDSSPTMIPAAIPAQRWLTSVWLNTWSSQPDDDVINDIPTMISSRRWCQINVIPTMISARQWYHQPDNDFSKTLIPAWHWFLPDEDSPSQDVHHFSPTRLWFQPDKDDFVPTISPMVPTGQHPPHTLIEKLIGKHTDVVFLSDLHFFIFFVILPMGGCVTPPHPPILTPLVKTFPIENGFHY